MKDNSGTQDDRPRQSKYDIHPMILNRWSARAMSGEGISDEELMTLFEAARWAPSSYNNQPWRFVYARKNSPFWSRFFDLLVEGNKSWAKNAAVLVLIISRKTFEYNNKPSRTHSFDAGAAWENLALEGTRRGLVVHAMQGFDYDKAREVASVPEDHEVEAMVAIGKPGKREDLPEKLRQNEFPNQRKPLRQIIREGKFS